MFDPWEDLASRSDVTLYVRRLDGGAVGLTDGVSRIWLDDRLNQVELRCTLTHEIAHLVHGHRRCQPLAIEMRVCQWAARKLISMEDLARVLPWSECLFEMADELHVTPQTLRDRLHGLTESERGLLAAREMMRAA